METFITILLGIATSVVASYVYAALTGGIAAIKLRREKDFQESVSRLRHDASQRAMATMHATQRQIFGIVFLTISLFVALSITMTSSRLRASDGFLYGLWIAFRSLCAVTLVVCLTISGRYFDGALEMLKAIHQAKVLDSSDGTDAQGDA